MKTRPSRYCTLCGYKLLIYCRPKPSRTKRIGTVFNIGFAFVFTCVAAAMMWTGGINAWWEISLIGLAITFCPQVWWLRTHIQGNRVLETVRLSSQIAMFCLLASSAIYWILPFWLMMSPDISEILNALISKLGLHNNQLNPWWCLLIATAFGHATIFEVVGTEVTQRGELDEELDKVYLQRTYE